MKVAHRLDQVGATTKPIVLAAGVFDGAHRGHQAVFARARAAARSHRGDAWVMTFQPHPLRILTPRLAPPMLATEPERRRQIAALGLDGYLVLPFSKRLAREQPMAFLQRLARCIPTLREIVVGKNWTFGYQARGNVQLLKQQAPRFGWTITVVPAVRWQGERISSQRIREAVMRGALRSAAHMLGRPYSVSGKVVAGRQFGRTMNFPTANIRTQAEILPPPGIYAVWTTDGRTLWPGAAFLGDPTIQGPVVEVHIFNLRRNLYGKTLSVLFLRRLRGVRHFATTQALRAQIARDCQRAALLLKRAVPPRIEAGQYPTTKGPDRRGGGRA